MPARSVYALLLVFVLTPALSAQCWYYSGTKSCAPTPVAPSLAASEAPAVHGTVTIERPRPTQRSTLMEPLLKTHRRSCTFHLATMRSA